MIIDTSQHNHYLLRKSIARYQQQQRRKRPKPHALPPLDQPIYMHNMHPRHPGAQHSVDVMAAVEQYQSNEPYPVAKISRRHLNNSRDDPRCLKPPSTHDNFTGVPREWRDNLQRWAQLVDAGLPDELPDQVGAEQETKEEEITKQQAPVKTMRRRRQLMKGGQKK